MEKDFGYCIACGETLIWDASFHDIKRQRSIDGKKELTTYRVEYSCHYCGYTPESNKIQRTRRTK
jgi:hypothetical protein